MNEHTNEYTNECTNECTNEYTNDYMQVSKEAALCLMYNFLANGALDRNEVTKAIGYYDKAIATGYVDQQGVLLVSRMGLPREIVSTVTLRNSAFCRGIEVSP